MKYFVTLNVFNTRHTDKYIDLLSKSIEVCTSENDEEKCDNKIFLGDFECELSRSAKKALSDALYDKSEGTVGYAIVKNGGSIAVVWSDFHMEEAAIEALSDKLPEMNDGFVLSVTTELMPYLEERARGLAKKKWKTLEERLGKEHGPAIVDAMKDFYALISDRKIVEWAANLYDAKAGAWYCSNSARDNEPFLPDVDSTYFALSFIASSGMAEMFDGDWARAVPDWLRDKVADFIISMQDEDSFFYHKQWPKEYIIETNNQPRLTRDKTTALRVLSKLGRSPKYSEPQKKAQDSAPKMLTQYESKENFTAFIDGIEKEILAIENPADRAVKFYYYGNLFQQGSSYFAEKPELKEIFIRFIEKYQNPQNGMWSDTVCYHGANAMHKIVNTANNIGYKLKYIDEMVDSILEIINYRVEDKPAAGAIYIYNTWSCLPYIYENIMKYGDGTEKERLARKTAIKNRVLAATPEALRAAVEQMRGFKMPDGAFAYSRNGAPGVSLRCPAAIAGTKEADIGGNSVAVTVLKLYIFMALELEEAIIPPVFTEYERLMYMDILEKLRASASE